MTGHLLHIGYPKAGSTFLQHWFESHPQLAYGAGAIAGFGRVYDIAREGTKQSDEILYRVTSYEGLSAPRPDAGRTSVDYVGLRGLSIVAAQQRVCTMLAELFPRSTVLIVTRGFRSMILSSFSQYARSGGDVDPEELVRRAQQNPDSQETEWWNYDRLIALYEDAFGADNVVVMPYELLRDDADEFIRVLAARLGIDAHPASRARVNESLSGAEIRWYPRLTNFARRLRSRRVFEAYVDAAMHNRLRHPIAILQRLRPVTPFTAASIPPELIEAFRGRAESLRTNPLYARYAADYLLD